MELRVGDIVVVNRPHDKIYNKTGKVYHNERGTVFVDFGEGFAGHTGHRGPSYKKFITTETGWFVQPDECRVSKRHRFQHL